MGGHCRMLKLPFYKYLKWFNGLFKSRRCKNFTYHCLQMANTVFASILYPLQWSSQFDLLQNKNNRHANMWYLTSNSKVVYRSMNIAKRECSVLKKQHLIKLINFIKRSTFNSKIQFQYINKTHNWCLCLYTLKI